MLPFLMPSYGEATTLSGLLALTTSAIITFRMRQYITWKRLIPILITFIVISAGAICMLTRIHDDILRKILGIVLIITALYFAFFSSRIKLKTTLPYQIGAGTISGIMGGFFGMQGPPAVMTGTLLGSWAFRHIPGKIFPYVVYSYIGICGLIILITT